MKTKTHFLRRQKKSLKKFKGDSETSRSSAAIRLEPTFFTGNEEALLAAGYIKGKGRGKPVDGERGEKWKCGRPGKGVTQVGEFQHMESRRQTGRV